MAAGFVAVALLALAGCAGTGGSSARPATAGLAAVSAPTEPARILLASAEAWNRGDLDGFLLPYLHSDRTTFVGSSGLIRGLDRVREAYRRSYWSEGRPPTRLAFEELETRPLGPDHALMTGRFILTRPDDGDVASTGFFSLVWERTADGWRIIHDHSSAAAPADGDKQTNPGGGDSVGDEPGA